MSEAQEIQLSIHALVRTSYRFLSAFDSIRHRDVRIARLLNSAVLEVLQRGAPGVGWRRRLLDSLPGRLYLRARSRRHQGRLEVFRGRGVILKRSAAYDHLLEDILPRLRAPYGRLATLDSRGASGSADARLAHLVPGRVHPPLAGEVAALYADVLGREPGLRDLLPQDPAWFVSLLEVMRDTVDAAEVFWDHSGCTGAVVFSHMGPVDLALGLAGRRRGRPVVVVQHGYLYETVAWEPEFADLYLAWDSWTTGVLRRASGGRMRTRVVGPFELSSHLRAPPPVARGRRRPRVLLLTSGESGRMLRYYEERFRALAAEDLPWDLVWRPHPRARRFASEFAERYTLDLEPGRTYARILEADLVLSPLSSTLVEAHYLGRRSACMARGEERPHRRWCEVFGVPWIDPEGDLVAGVRRALAMPPPPGPARWTAEDASRMAGILDATLRGQDPRRAG